MDINEWITCSVKQNASDLHLCSGYPPMWRIGGALQRIQSEAACCSSEQLTRWSESWMTALQCQQLQTQGQADGALTTPDGIRLRAHLFHQHAGLSIALRTIATTAHSLDSLYAPPILSTLIQRPAGLILVTGATGSGKSTTLVAMVNALRQQQSCHVVTLEDPIEFVYSSEYSGAHGLIQQREIGVHCPSFAHGIRGALREDPDVILLGELRDGETIRLALTAAETGHLVLATLHTRGAAQAVERLLDVFPAQEKDFVRSQLALCLQGVVAQQLVPRRGGGRIALYEILLANTAVANLIREGKSHQLPGLLQMGGQSGMQTFAQSWQQRCKEGLLPPDAEQIFTPQTTL